MKYAHLYATPDGESHIEEVELDFGDRAACTFLVDGVRFVRLPAGDFNDWHCDPWPQFVVTLVGSTDNVTSDGSRITVSPGKIVLVEDDTGKGHRSIVDKASDRILMAISLADRNRMAAIPADLALLRRANKGVHRIHRLSTTPDGGTTFDEIEVEMGDTLLAQAGLRPVELVFTGLQAGTFLDWHPVPRPELHIQLTGEVEILATDGTRLRVVPGTVMLALNATGKGHQSRVNASSDERHLSIWLEPSA